MTEWVAVPDGAERTMAVPSEPNYGCPIGATIGASPVRAEWLSLQSRGVLGVCVGAFAWVSSAFECGGPAFDPDPAPGYIAGSPAPCLGGEIGRRARLKIW